MPHAEDPPVPVNLHARPLPTGLPAWNFETDTTLLRVLARNAAAFGNLAALREKDKGIWQQTTWQQALDAVLACAAGLDALGFGPGMGLMVLGDNRPRLYLGMLAAGALRGYAMPVYPDATPDELRHFSQELTVHVALADDQEQVDKVLDLRDNGAAIAHVVYDDPRGMGRYQAPGLQSWDALLAAGQKRLDAEAGLRQSLLDRAGAADPAVLVHSSGTTGRPKGVPLTHRNLLEGVRNGWQGGAFDFGEDVLAYLPMAWVGDFAFTIAAGVALRFTINIPERAETVLHDLREIAPTFYLASPRSWDNMLTTIQVRMADSTPLKRKVYDFFLNSALGAERRKLEGKAPTTAERWLRPLGEALVFGPIKDQLGLTRLRHAFTGGEAIGEDTFVFYRALGVQLRQLYGQTECSAYNAMQEASEVQLHTVGRPLPGVAVQISESGEILVRSGSVFGGYLNQPDASRDALDGGWLHTGDAGYLEKDGHLVVLGRVSEVVHTSKGERYIPNYIENRLKFSAWVKDVAVLGAGRDWLGAIVCIDKESVGHWAELEGISYMSYADLAGKPQVMDLVRQAVQHVNATLPEPLRLRRFVCLHKEFDADDGEVTRTRKLRRNVVEERYAPIIDALYAGQDAVTMKAQITYETGEVGVIETPAAFVRGGRGLSHGLDALRRTGAQRRHDRADVFAGRHRHRADLQVQLGAQPGAGRADHAGRLRGAGLERQAGPADVGRHPAGDGDDVLHRRGHRTRGAAPTGRAADHHDPDDDAGPGHLPARRRDDDLGRHRAQAVAGHSGRSAVPGPDPVEPSGGRRGGGRAAAVRHLPAVLPHPAGHRAARHLRRLHGVVVGRHLGRARGCLELGAVVGGGHHGRRAVGFDPGRGPVAVAVVAQGRDRGRAGRHGQPGWRGAGRAAAGHLRRRGVGLARPAGGWRQPRPGGGRHADPDHPDPAPWPVRPPRH
jgi:long-chain acyl-CoA synthetase